MGVAKSRIPRVALATLHMDRTMWSTKARCPRDHERRTPTNCERRVETGHARIDMSNLRQSALKINHTCVCSLSQHEQRPPTLPSMRTATHVPRAWLKICREVCEACGCVCSHQWIVRELPTKKLFAKKFIAYVVRWGDTLGLTSLGWCERACEARWAGVSLGTGERRRQVLRVLVGDERWSVWSEVG